MADFINRLCEKFLIRMTFVLLSIPRAVFRKTWKPADGLLSARVTTDIYLVCFFKHKITILPFLFYSYFAVTVHGKMKREVLMYNLYHHGKIATLETHQAHSSYRWIKKPRHMKYWSSNRLILGSSIFLQWNIGKSQIPKLCIVGTYGWMFLRKLSLISGLPSRFHILHRTVICTYSKLKCSMLRTDEKVKIGSWACKNYNSSYDFLVLSHMHTFC